MRAVVFDEPPVEFAGGSQHVDPRFGVADYGPVDLGTQSAPSEIRVGVVGPADGIDGARRWLESCREPIPAKQSDRGSRLFRDFPGFDNDTTFRSRLTFDEALTRTLSSRTLARAASRPGALGVVDVVDLYAAEVADLAATNRCDVILCARPDGLEEEDAGAASEDGALDGPSVEVDARRVDFRDLLKAKTLHATPPLQLIRSSTWDPTRAKVRKAGRRRGTPGQLQDEATRAWNIHTALYYKAGGVPWRLVRAATDLSTLFVGVSFFHTPERDSVHTSVAQVFNDRGDGVVVRGGPAARRKDDRQPHLSGADAQSLLGDALAVYRRTHHNFPARVVLHKTSEFDDAEVRGFEAAIDALGIEHLDLVWVQASERIRLFRNGDNAVARGTFVQLEERRGALFTRGTIDFYRLYPGMYVPVPIGLRVAVAERSVEELAREILALSKMNWNQSQLDGRLPITLRASARVANVLKHVAIDDRVAPRYAHYM
ncbi:MAG TPA: hypothetical protein VHC63_14315 [Acidimicrobiales bacterium]|nr:hypothetical protein [Acidimicrobiales bacterium]